MRREWKSDGAWIMFWPLTMGIGIWGVGLIYQSAAEGRPTFWVGLALLCGGGFLSGRWVAQARHLYRAAKGRPGAIVGGTRHGRV